ncbi:MAG: hypothetical protein KA120_05400 [Candidatus Goldbacteria bacterium]|nr:hypothetical protein [Candidatus Goldiibacteriota bacterium]
MPGNRNKNTIIIISFILIIVSVFLTFVTNESKYFHIWYQILIIPVILLSFFLSIKDVIIIIMVVSGVVWTMGFMGKINNIYQLLFETLIIIISAISLGWNELLYKKEREKIDTVIDYKKKQIEEMKNRIDGLNKESNLLLDEIKSIKKQLTD